MSDWTHGYRDNPLNGLRVLPLCSQCKSRIALAPGHTMCQWCLDASAPPKPEQQPEPKGKE
jgi:hypothetical protein